MSNTHDYQPWTDPLAVQPMRCPCCGGEAGVWRYVAKPGAEVLRVVMCNAPEFEDAGLPIVLDWNRYGEALLKRRKATGDAL